MKVRTRGRTIAAIVIAVCSAAACSKAGSPASPSPAIGSPPEASLQASGADQSAVAAVRRATAAFHDVDQAVAAGYLSPVGGHCDASPAGAMGVHSANPRLIQDGILNPETPEVLLYIPTGGGNYRLTGVEYLVPILLRNTETGARTPWFGADRWPALYEEVNPRPSLFGHAFQGPMAGHVAGMPWHYDLHVWIWAPNPSGMFAQWNPSITCN